MTANTVFVKKCTVLTNCAANRCREEYYLTTNKEHLVSRKSQGDIVLADDESVSRTHAKLDVSFSKEHVDNPAVLPDVFLIECNSKYGTYVNKSISTNTQLAVGSRVQLKDGDRLRFGIQHNEWKLHHVPLIVTTSTLNTEQKMNLSKTITELGGHVVADWRDDCTHVTMNRITLTVKVVCALARGRHIVEPTYWQLYLSAARDKTQLPDCADHVPPLAERSLSASNVSFAVDERRASLFKGRLFVFHSVEQRNAFSCMVFAAGGMCVIADGCGMSDEEMLAPHVVVMGYPFERGSQETQHTDSFKRLKSYMTSNGKRLISESEIGLAVLHCSMEHYCNPQLQTANSGSASQSRAAPNRSTLVRATQEASQQQERLVNTESSQDSFPSLRTKRRNRVPALIVESDSESCPEQENAPAPAAKADSAGAAETGGTGAKKRLRSAFCDPENPSKKIATEPASANKLHNVQVSGFSKEKHSEQGNCEAVSSFRTQTADDSDMFASKSRRDANSSELNAVAASLTSRRKSDSSDEEESLFTFIDDSRKPGKRRRNNSGDEGSAMFTFVGEAQASRTANNKRNVRNVCDDDSDDAAFPVSSRKTTGKNASDSDGDGDDDDYNDTAERFAFIEDPSEKFAERYFPDRTWAGSKRPIQEASGEDSSVEEPPLKRLSLEKSRHSANRTVSLNNFTSVVKIKDEDVSQDEESREYASKLPDYVLGMNDTVVVTVGTLVVSIVGQNSSVDVTDSSHSRNYKKFKKVKPVRKNIVPMIIGGRDLVAADSDSQQQTVNGNIAEPEDGINSTFHFLDD